MNDTVSDSWTAHVPAALASGMGSLLSKHRDRHVSVGEGPTSSTRHVMLDSYGEPGQKQHEVTYDIATVRHSGFLQAAGFW